MNVLEVYSPYDNSLIQSLTFNDADDVENALIKAKQLHQQLPQGLPAYQRIAILEKFSQLIAEQIEEITKLATHEGGKPYQDSKVEVLRAINGVKIATQTISQIHGEQVPMGLTSSSDHRIAFTTKEPIGVVVAISAFNHPFNLIVHQVATAVAASCPVLVKPALTTPLSCLKFIELLYQSGLPKDWAQVLICEDKIAEQLATDSRVAYLTFIGSAKVGWHLRSKIAAGTRVALEHGGIAPVIVEEDADFSELIPAIIKGGFYHAGQVCVSTQRIFVHENKINEIANQLVVEAKKMIVGNPLDEKTQVGPLILPREVDRVESWVNEAVIEGAILLCGGNRISNSCFEPTILLNPLRTSLVSTHEIFGPVICLYSYSNINEAIIQANDTPFLFQAAVFTKNIDKAFAISKQLNASSVMINDHTAFRVDWMPFGGRSQSGIGVGGIQFTINEMLQDKLVVIKTKG